MEPVKIFSDTPQLKCSHCGKNLLNDPKNGNFIVFEKGEDLQCIRYACKEHDKQVTDAAKKEGLKDAGWDDIDDLLIPTIWLKKFMAFINEMREKNENISDQYFGDVKMMFINTFPYVARNMTKNEFEKFGKLMQLES